MEFLAFVEVFYAKLGIGSATVVVLHYAIADIHRVAGFDMVEVVGHIESSRRNMMVRLRFLNKFEPEVPSLGTHLTDISVVIYIICPEHRHAVARTERLELLQDTKELRSDLREVQSSIYVYDRCLHFRNDGS